MGFISLIFFNACTSSHENENVNPQIQSSLPLTQTSSQVTHQTATQTTVVYFTPTIGSPSTLTPKPTQSRTPTIIPSPTNTLEPLEIFSSDQLRNGVSPQSYLDDMCLYLENRWSPEGSFPGTVVVPIMFHSIYKDGRVVNDPKEISETEFDEFITSATSLGYETITIRQLLDFLDHNAYIPQRSMIMIVDDRRPGLIQERFIPVLNEHDWTVTAAYISDPDSLDWAWELMDRLYETGRVDIQSHGYSGQLYIVEATTAEEIHDEIDRSTVVLEERYGIRPIAFIWPGGNFTQLAVEIARLDGYQLGFTAYSRGPLMYNWIPLGEEERSIGDPLMLLPRAWSNSASFNLQQAIEIGERASAFAMENYPKEANWYETVCEGELVPPAEDDLELAP